MNIGTIVQTVNAKLAGESLTYSDLKVHLDAVIDDINDKLNACFPSFSEFNPTDYPNYPDYNFFPDKFIRQVVANGAAFYFYITDEEGADSAPKYEQFYTRNLFVMQRDHSDKVPVEFQMDGQGYVTATPTYTDPDDLIFDF